ncbi:heavy metal translocating P-type ATPase [Halorubrum salipaludis]|uniref:Heavy metal translocating P-type ATPase n=1 Tax=Halorubrum salipaludis TaxID=2032630 RepID=A0A2A2FE41_9EURY|nr:cation-translocating P-type ATPase [Halorubrum salipaludis]PAU82892.1 heavy metal translocating P-type ATPase [Halorubrum salipaludis]
MSDCRLCDLPTPDPPVTESGVDGEFCCRGCLEVARRLDDVGDAEAGVGEGEGATLGAEGSTPGTDEATLRADDSGGKAPPSDAAEAYLAVDGMHCTTCETFLGLRGDDCRGVRAVEANYGTETARVVYDPAEIDRDELPEALSGYGYALRFRNGSETGGGDASDRTGGGGRAGRRRDDRTVERLVVGGFLAMLIMPWYVLSLYPSYLGIETNVLAIDTTTAAGRYLPLAFIALLTTVLLAYTGAPLLRGAYVSVRARRPNMDLLVAVAALSAYAYSTLALATGSTHLYYDVTVAVVMVVSLGRFYEERVRARATDLLETVTAARVESATRVTGAGSETVPIADLEPGDRIRVTPGERVPIDGTVIEGTADVDESVITGESLPVRKGAGETVIGGATLLGDVRETDGGAVDGGATAGAESAGAIAVRVGEDAESTADRLAAALWEVQTATPGIQRFVDALATVFVPVVLTLGLVVAGWRLATGGTVAAAMLAGLTVLVVSCPCAMGLATPLAVSGGLRDALDRGAVVTDASVFEVAREADTVVFDKTGTLTAGEMRVAETHGDDRTLRRAAAIERRADHPVADAIREAAAGDLAEGTRVESFTRHPGAGISGRLVPGDGWETDSPPADARVVVGTPDLVESECGPMPDDLRGRVDDVADRGALPVAVGWDGAARGVIAVEDREREGWAAALDAFADREVAVLTGDEGPRADRFRDHPAVDEVFAGVPPDGKLEAVRGFAASGTTVMVGDGTNDAPALAAADLGIAMGDGTARAVEAADVVIADEDLRAVETVFDLAAGTRRRIRENVAWALCYNAVAIPLAVAGLLNPFFAALAMAASSGIVVTNSTRSVL